MRLMTLVLTAAVLPAAVGFPQTTGENPPPGYVSLFNGKDLTGWKIPEGDNGHWKVVDGVIDYDARSEAAKDKNLWTVKEYGDFVLRVEWRFKDTPFVYRNGRIL